MNNVFDHLKRHDVYDFDKNPEKHGFIKGFNAGIDCCSDEQQKINDQKRELPNSVQGYNLNSLLWMKQLIEDRAETMDFDKAELDSAYEDIRMQICARVAAPVVSREGWKPLSEWHEDLGQCLFIFNKNGDYWGMEWTSPITFDADGTSFYDKYGECNDIQFKIVDTSDFTLLEAAAKETHNG